MMTHQDLDHLIAVAGLACIGLITVYGVWRRRTGRGPLRLPRLRR